MRLADCRSPLLTALHDLLVTSPAIDDLLREHRDDAGRCAVCKSGDSTGRAVYPCTIRTGAERAWLTQQQGVRGI